MTTLSIAEVAQVTYLECQIRLDDEARELAAKGLKLPARILRHQAAVAYRAAKAEQDDPDWEPNVVCRICNGVRVCDWAAHLGAGPNT